jgi:NAD+ kinase
MMRVAIIGSPEKEAAAETLERTRRWLEGRAEVVFAELTYDSSRSLSGRPEMLVVLGGDGTLIAAVHGLREKQLPIVGVNLGKLGFLAEFTIDDLEREGDFLFRGDLPITRRVMLDVRVERIGGSFFRTPAVNDCVIFAGPPFRMIEMTVEADGDEVARVRGDGLIVATASGSTAHNLSAGGPILEPTAESFILTPICPHALTYRPLTLDSRRRIVLRVTQANPGTTVAIDGHICRPFQANDRIVLTRYEADCLVVRNPKRSAWYALRQKLMWGESPTMQ